MRETQMRVFFEPEPHPYLAYCYPRLFASFFRLSASFRFALSKSSFLAASSASMTIFFCACLSSSRFCQHGFGIDPTGTHSLSLKSRLGFMAAISDLSPV